MTPFDWVKQITVEKREWNSFTEEEQSNFNPFIVNKTLSFNKDYIQVVEMAMTYPMPPQKLYEFYRDVIPKKPIWSKWVKGQVVYDEEELKFISEYFECSQRESKDIVNLLDSQVKDVILLEVKGSKDDKKKRRVQRNNRNPK